jgi:branched-chain amino acid transport system permease protein
VSTLSTQPDLETMGPHQRRTPPWVDDPRLRRGANAIAAILVFYWVLERLWPAPAGVLLKGMVIGGLYALIALGLSLVYRANRIINFAQGDLGGAPAALAVLLIVSVGVPYVVGILTGLVAGVVLGIVVEFVVIRRFAKAPRLILTVATLGLSAVLAAAEVGLPTAFHVKVAPQNFQSPFSFAFRFHKVVFQGNDLLALAAVPVVIVALAWFLNRTHMGVAVRACAESSDRASLLGVPVKRVNMVVWAVASLLATVALILRAGVIGLPIGSALGLPLLLPTLAAAAIGRMERMPTIVVAAVLFGVVEQSVVWHTGSGDIVDLVSFLVIVAALLAQRGRLATRAEQASMSAWTALREIRPMPPELAGLPEVVWSRRALLALIGVVAVISPFVLGEAKTTLAVTLIVFMIVGLSLLVLAGWAGQISLGQFAFVGVGSATGAWMSLHLQVDIVLELVVAGLAGAAVAVVIGVPALRIRGLFLAVATLGFTQAASSYFLKYTHFGWIPTQDKRIERLPVFGRIAIDSEARYYFFCLAVLLACIFAVRGLRRSRTGRVLVALRENDRAVQAFGVNVVRAKLTAFAISGFLAAVGGVLLVHLQHALYPGGISPVSSLSAFVMVVIGGLGSITGVFSGAFYLNGLSWVKSWFPRSIQPLLQLMGSGLGLVIILMLLPGGVGSVLFRARDSLLRRLAERRGIVVPSLVADKLVTAEADRVMVTAPAAAEMTTVAPVSPAEAAAELAELESVGARPGAGPRGGMDR